MSKAWAQGSTYQWRAVRARVLRANAAENGGRCVVQLPDVCEGQANQVHHTMGRAVTGDDPRYLVAVCGACNRAIGEPKHNSPQHRRVSEW